MWNDEEWDYFFWAEKLDYSSGRREVGAIIFSEEKRSICIMFCSSSLLFSIFFDCSDELLIRKFRFLMRKKYLLICMF